MISIASLTGMIMAICTPALSLAICLACLYMNIRASCLISVWAARLSHSQDPPGDFDSQTPVLLTPLYQCVDVNLRHLVEDVQVAVSSVLIGLLPPDQRIN